ncbi:hypothetical protein V6N00_12655 [Tersicoccus sp. MR15.9]|uniref:hypothetical protein n=1 Tax=Tersicoccus mangrovi TaxID=3121635 RepID=UPI002FE51F0B
MTTTQTRPTITVDGAQLARALDAALKVSRDSLHAQGVRLLVRDEALVLEVVGKRLFVRTFATLTAETTASFGPVAIDTHMASLIYGYALDGPVTLQIADGATTRLIAMRGETPLASTPVLEEATIFAQRARMLDALLRGRVRPGVMQLQPRIMGEIVELGKIDPAGHPLVMFPVGPGLVFSQASSLMDARPWLTGMAELFRAPDRLSTR